MEEESRRWEVDAGAPRTQFQVGLKLGARSSRARGGDRGVKIGIVSTTEICEFLGLDGRGCGYV